MLLRVVSLSPTINNKTLPKTTWGSQSCLKFYRRRPSMEIKQTLLTPGYGTGEQAASGRAHAKFLICTYEINLTRTLRDTSSGSTPTY